MLKQVLCPCLATNFTGQGMAVNPIHLPDNQLTRDRDDPVNPRVSMEMHTDIEVLKSRIEVLTQTVGHVSDKLDLIMQMQVQLVRLQEQFENARHSIDRAHTATQSAQARISDIDISIGSFKSTAKTVLIISGFIFSIVQMLVVGQLDRIRDNSMTLVAIERRLIKLEESRYTQYGFENKVDRSND